VGHGGGTLGNKVMNIFPLFFSKLNRTALHVNMPGGRTLSAHGAGKLIVKTDGQTETEKDTYAKLFDEDTPLSLTLLYQMKATNK
jgi:hypothetical protein